MKAHKMLTVFFVLRTVIPTGIVLTGPALCEEFQKKGYRVVALCLSGRRKTSRLTLREALGNLVPRIEVIRGVRYYFPPTINLPLLQIFTPYLTAGLFSVLYFRNLRPGLVYSIDTNICGVFARIMRRITNAELFFDYGDPFWEHRRDLTARGWSLLERVTLSYTGRTAVACLYPSTLKYMRTRYPHVKSELAPRGYYPEDFLSVSAEAGKSIKSSHGLEGARIVFYGGTLDLRVYRPDVMLEACLKLVDDFPDARVVIAGSGNWLRELRARVSSSGLQHRILTLGEVPRADFLKWVSVADVCVATYAGSPASKIYEYLAFSKPVVMALGSRESGIFVNDVNCLITPLDSENLCSAVTSVLTDPRLAQRIGMQGFEAVRDLTWEKVAEKRIAMIEEVFSSKQVTPLAKS